ncbi:MAG: Na+/H+ antiporter NhaC family protein [Acidobacteriota bacterium]
MSGGPSAWVLLPPLVAIALAVRTRQVHLSLLAGIWIGALLVTGGHPLAGTAGTVEIIVQAATEPGNARVLLFCLLIGPLVLYLETFQGVAGMVGALERRGLAGTPRGVRLLAWITGVVIFVESNVTLLVTGAVGRPLFDRHRLPREQLAYLADSTSAPVCVLIPFNAWGAFILGLLEAQHLDRPLAIFAAAIPLNLYAIVALVLAGVVAWTGWSIGPMRHAGRRREPAAAVPTAFPEAMPTSAARPPAAAPPRAVNMVVPLAVMIASMPVGLFITGGGDLGAGSGSTSALWAVLAGNIAAWILIRAQRLATVPELVRLGIRGMESLLGPVLILVLSMALGAICAQLGTGLWLADRLQAFPVAPVLLPATFLVSAAIAFATGTSWGTFAMTIPIAVPAAASLALPVAPFLAACLSGGIFGDHASPISDTTVVASLATGTGVIDHVRTQMPYALLSAGAALIGFAILGVIL